jgi:hypothetical protein
VEVLRTALQDHGPLLRTLYSQTSLTVYGDSLDQAGRIPSFLTFVLLALLHMSIELRCRRPDDVWGWPSAEALPRLQNATQGFALRNNVAAPLPRRVWVFAFSGCFVGAIGQPPACQLTRLDAWLRQPPGRGLVDGKMEAADPLPNPVAADAAAAPAAQAEPEQLDDEDPNGADPRNHDDEDDDGSDGLLLNDDRAADPDPAVPPVMPELSDRVEGRQALSLREYDNKYFREGRGGLPEPLLPSAYSATHALHLQRSSKDCLDAANGLTFVTSFDIDTVALLTTFSRVAAAERDMTLSLLTAKNLGGRVSARSRMLHPDTRRPLRSLPNLRIGTLFLDSHLRAMDVFLVFPEGGGQHPHRVWQNVWPQALADVGGPPKLSKLSYVDWSALATFSQQAVAGVQLRKVRHFDIVFAVCLLAFLLFVVFCLFVCLFVSLLWRLQSWSISACCVFRPRGFRCVPLGGLLDCRAKTLHS